MKNLKTIFAFIIACTFMLVGCTDFADTPGKSVWSEGVWILPWLTGLGSAWFGYVTYRAATSGSIVKVPDPERGPGATKEVESDKNVPFWEIGQFYFSVGLFIATVFIIWNVLSNR